MSATGKHTDQPSSLVTHLHQTRNPLLTACLPLIFLWNKQAQTTQIPFDKWQQTSEAALTTITGQIQDQGYAATLIQRLSDMLKAFINDRWSQLTHSQSPVQSLVVQPEAEPFQQLFNPPQAITANSDHELDLLEAALVLFNSGYTGQHWALNERQRSQLLDRLNALIQSKRPVPPADFEVTTPTTSTPSAAHNVKTFFSNLPIKHVFIALGLTIIAIIAMNISTYHRLKLQSQPIQMHINIGAPQKPIDTKMETQDTPYESHQ